MEKKILVVDDSVTIRQQLRLALSPAGFDVIEAGDGIEGLKKMNEDPDIAMAICDVNMPRMDGLEMIKKMREAGHEVPLLMLTTEGQPALIRKAKEAGAKGWIVKPFKADLLVKAVQKLAR